jgi:hypothetical protein
MFFRHGMRQLFRVVYHKRLDRFSTKVSRQQVKLADMSFASTSKQWNEVFAEGKQGGMPKKILSQRMIVEVLFCKTAMRIFSKQRIVEYEL